MPERRVSPPLTQRDREILKDIVQTYILSGEPVSSRAVARDEHTGSTSWDGYAATSVVDAAVASLEDESSPMVDVTLIDKPAFYA